MVSPILSRVLQSLTDPKSSIISIKPKGADQDDQAHKKPPSNEKSDSELSSSDESDIEQPDNKKPGDEQTKDHVLLEQCYSWLFSRQHFQIILADPDLSKIFEEYVRANKPDSAPLLDYYVDSVKILRLMKYADAIACNLKPVQGQSFTSRANSTTIGFPWVVQSKLDQALDALMTDDFPAFLTSQYLEFVDHALSEGVTNLQDVATVGKLEGLAEAFFLYNPTIVDNPTIYSSDGLFQPMWCIRTFLIAVERISPYQWPQSRTMCWPKLDVFEGFSSSWSRTSSI